MSAAGPFLRRVDGGYFAQCPGCNTWHHIAVEKPLPNGARWTFDGNLEAPTFSPSLSVKTGQAVDPSYVREEGDPPGHCHSFIRSGHWEFCSDSTHALAGLIVPMPEWKEA
ncbi:DUF6527 family protein [Brevundimonas sp. GCM10030266]|uniref:DUF6527 family protein n=1 Tax=Brevundimonas sp. GCM10030266 TaxID=3273386 RepID=UPI003618A350